MNEFASSLLRVLTDKEHTNAIVLALTGQLGAGKTTFVQQLGSLLSIANKINSPTFNIMKIYEVENNANFKFLVHLDVYRLDSVDELRPLHFNQYLEDLQFLTVIEWADKIKEVLPGDAIYLDFINTGEEQRTIVIEGPAWLVESL